MPLAFGLGFAIFWYFVFASTEIIFAKTLNDKLGVDDQVLWLALTFSAYWPLQAATHYYLWGKRDELPAEQRDGTPPFRERAKSLVFIGISSTGVISLRAFALNGLPGSLFVIIASTDVVFNTLMSKFFLNQSFTKFHYLSAALSMCATITSALDFLIQPSEDDDGSSSDAEIFGAISACLASAFLSAANAVVSEYAMKRLTPPGGKKPKTSLLSVSEVSLFNAAIPFFFLVVILFAEQNEVSTYGSTWRRLRSDDKMKWYILLLVGLSFGKMCDRFCKFFTVSRTSAFFFVILDTVRRIFTGLLSIFIFEGGDVGYLKIISVLLMISSLAAFAKGIKCMDAMKKAEAAVQTPSSNSLALHSEGTPDSHVVSSKEQRSDLIVDESGGDGAMVRRKSRSMNDFDALALVQFPSWNSNSGAGGLADTVGGARLLSASHEVQSTPALGKVGDQHLLAANLRRGGRMPMMTVRKLSFLIDDGVRRAMRTSFVELNASNLIQTSFQN